MKYSEITRRLASFWTGESEGRFFSQADPEAAEALEMFFNMNRNALESGQGVSISNIIPRLEVDTAERAAEILWNLAPEIRRERLQAMHPSRRDLVLVARNKARDKGGQRV